ncbi:hypothetical protein D3C72_977210 [compost metagenome]
MQFIEAEHRQGQGHHQRSECAQHPRVLQRGGKPFPGEAGRHAHGSVDHRHPQHVGQRDQQRPAARHMLAYDDRRQDRHHGQHARREGQQQAQSEEQRGDETEVAASQRPGDPIVVVPQRDGGPGCFLRHWGGCGRWFGRCRRLRCRRGGRTVAEQVAEHRPAHLVDALHRRIAEPLVRAALRGHHQGPTAIARGLDHGHAHHHAATIGLHVLAEVLVEMDLTLRQRRRPELDRGRLGGERKSLTVHVVAVRHIKADFDRLRVQLFRRELERLLWRQEILLGRGMGHVPEQQAGAQHQHRCDDLPHSPTPHLPSRSGAPPHADARSRRSHVAFPMLQCVSAVRSRRQRACRWPPPAPTPDTAQNLLQPAR